MIMSLSSEGRLSSLEGRVGMMVDCWMSASMIVFWKFRALCRSPTSMHFKIVFSVSLYSSAKGICWSKLCVGFMPRRSGVSHFRISRNVEEKANDSTISGASFPSDNVETATNREATSWIMQ